MKVCLINNLYPPYARGGAEQVVQKTVEGLLREGHRVVLITTSPNGAEIERAGEFSHYRFRPWNLFFYTEAHRHSFVARFFWHLANMFHFGAARRVKNILKQERPDAVHTHNLMGMSFLIPRVIRKLGIRHVHTVHDVQFVEPSGIILKRKEMSARYTGFPTRIYSSIMKRLMGSPDVVISPSQFLLDFYVGRGFFPTSKKVVVRNPVTFEEAVGSRQQAVGGDEQNIFHFLYLGQIEKHKGVIFLTKTFLEFFNIIVSPKNSTAYSLLPTASTLHIVGDGSAMEEVKKLADENPNIIFHGRVDREQLPKIFGMADVTVVPSLCYENSPTVIFESFAFGVPVLASNIEGIAELIREGENGLTFGAGDAESLQEKMSWCLAHREELRLMGERTRESLVGLSEEEYVRKVVELYQN